MHSKNPNILVFGGGAVGGLLLSALARVIPEECLHVVCRSNYQQALESGFVLHSNVWDKTLFSKPVVVRSAQEAKESSQRPFDFVVVATKSSAVVPTISQQIRPAVSPLSIIVVIQNGVQVEEEFRREYPDNIILSVVSYVPVTQTQPAVFHHSRHGKIHLGTYPATVPSFHHEAAKSLNDLLNSSGIEAYYSEDIQIERWSKLLVNMENPLCALSRLRDVEYFQSAEGASDSLRRVMEEVASVARAAGYTSIDDSIVDRSMNFLTVRKLPGVEPSTMADALAGRPMEVEALLGNVLKLARKCQVDTPRVELLYYLMNGLNTSFQRR
ncbi:hypothetical protein NM208_g6296 [Fusarium decemcellulare]|uniref:Uncharacterized protein n=1 Tax=Fusarium decemcellulare TaxID=57161 RepID=A0ACC1SDI9_9HYPO|nr:hypothetical protein NM208_g6296 [Fusarium decemcellulare]